MGQYYDIVIVGSGINGAIVAAELHKASPTASILVLEAGREITRIAGEHLVEADANAMNASYNDLMRRARQIEYVKGATSMNKIEGDDWSVDLPGVFPAAFLGHNFASFPGASVAWNIGGMGVHWAAASPWAYGPEIPDFLPRDEWEADQQTARQALRVSSGPLVPNPFSQPMIKALREVVPSSDPDREAGYMPMAGIAHSDRPFARTGPRDIAPFLFDSNDSGATLRTGVLATRIDRTGQAATSIVGRDVVTGEETVYSGGCVVVAADSLRTPQLLWASGIRPDALGVRLNEHASIHASVAIDATLLGLAETDVPAPPPGEPFIGVYWSPSVGAERPTHGQLMEQIELDGTHSLSLGWYCATEIRPENRIEFSDDASDPLGMPLMTVHFSYTERDLNQIERTRDIQSAAADAIGAFRDQPEVLPAGASLHYTGTVRMGPSDDGTSVCDTDGRVWGIDNLYLVGNGVVPTALTCNSTLTGATLAVRTARAIANTI